MASRVGKEKKRGTPSGQGMNTVSDCREGDDKNDGCLERQGWRALMGRRAADGDGDGDGEKWPGG